MRGIVIAGSGHALLDEELTAQTKGIKTTQKLNEETGLEIPALNVLIGMSGRGIRQDSLQSVQKLTIAACLTNNEPALRTPHLAQKILSLTPQQTQQLYRAIERLTFTDRAHTIMDFLNGKKTPVTRTPSPLPKTQSSKQPVSPLPVSRPFHQQFPSHRKASGR
ncbi:MAG: hypothetical protein HY917_01445 [Candidatus Diapherotrites archaeon]|nr:hypothetical protein [Candidatus Diapherotrites archaeon]